MKTLLFALCLCLLAVGSGCENKANIDPKINQNAVELIEWLGSNVAGGTSPPPSFSLADARSLRDAQITILDNNFRVGQSILSLKPTAINSLETLVANSGWQAAEPMVVALDALLATAMVESGKRRNEPVFVNAAILRMMLIGLETEALGDTTPALEDKLELLLMIAKKASIEDQFFIDKIP